MTGMLGSAVELEFEVTSVSLSKIVWAWVPATRIDMVANLIMISVLNDVFEGLGDVFYRSFVVVQYLLV